MSPPHAPPRPRLAVLGFSVASALVLAAGMTALLTQSCTEAPPAKEPPTQPDVAPLPPTTDGNKPTAEDGAPKPTHSAPVVVPPPVPPPVT